MNRCCFTCMYYGKDSANCRGCSAKSNWKAVNLGVLIAQGIIVALIAGVAICLAVS